MVTFNAVPAASRVPFTFVEFDSSNASPAATIQPYKLLVIGQRKTGGTVAELVPTRVTNASQAREYFGAGSVCHRQAIALFANNVVTEAWFVAQDDAGAGTKASGTITVTGSATADGTVYFYVNGTRYLAAVSSGDTATDIGNAIRDALNLDPDSPTIAGAVTGVVTFSAQNDGEHGNDIHLAVNEGEGEAAPAGVSLAVAAMSGGTNNPDVTAVWPVLGDVHYNIACVPYTDTANLSAMDARGDVQDGPVKQLDIRFIGVHQDTHANLLTKAAAGDSRHIILGGVRNSKTQPLEIAAALAGRMAEEAQKDPARPFKTLVLNGVVPPNTVDEFTFTEADQLLKQGMTTFLVTGSGDVAVQRVVTSYKTNANSAPDEAYLSANTGLTLSLLRYEIRNMTLTKYPRHKLGDDGKAFAPGQAILTPSAYKGELLTLARSWEARGLVENAEALAEIMIVERNPTDVNRLDVLIQPDLVNQFLIAGVQIQFTL